MTVNAAFNPAMVVRAWLAGWGEPCKVEARACRQDSPVGLLLTADVAGPRVVAKVRGSWLVAVHRVHDGLHAVAAVALIP